jgi:hypothetical protein
MVIIEPYRDAIGGLLDDFWRHPKRRANKRGTFGQCVCDLASNTEVGKLNIPIVAKQDVGGC